MIRQYLPNNNETATVAFRQKFCQLNSPLVGPCENHAWCSWTASCSGSLAHTFFVQLQQAGAERHRERGRIGLYCTGRCLTTRAHGPLYSSSIRPSQQDSLLYTQFSRTHPSSISSSIHSIHCRTHLSLYLNISMCDLVLKDLSRRI
jgi:hypothetical protein